MRKITIQKSTTGLRMFACKQCTNSIITSLPLSFFYIRLQKRERKSWFNRQKMIDRTNSGFLVIAKDPAGSLAVSKEGRIQRCSKRKKNIAKTRFVDLTYGIKSCLQCWSTFVTFEHFVTNGLNNLFSSSTMQGAFCKGLQPRTHITTTPTMVALARSRSYHQAERGFSFLPLRQ